MNTSIIVLFNLVIALGLFVVNGALGALQYGYRGKLFQYGQFGFAMDEEENFAGNFFLKVVNPAIYLALCCALLQDRYNEILFRSLWLVIPLYWGIRLLFLIIKGRFFILNWRYEVVSIVLSLCLGEGTFFGVVIPLVNENESVFIPIDEIRNAIWFAIIAYIAKCIWDISKTRLNGQAIYPWEKREQIIHRRYEKFVNRFGSHILLRVHQKYPKDKHGKGNFICLLYAIMIYEDYNRPKLYRLVENFLKTICPQKVMTIGIMQVKSKEYITDLESIDLAIEKLLEVYQDNFHNNPIGHAIEDYNGGSEFYYEEVSTIYSVLLELLSIDELIEDNEAYTI